MTPRFAAPVCDDEGVISNWEDLPFDARRRRLTLAGAVNEIAFDAFRALEQSDP